MPARDVYSYTHSGLRRKELRAATRQAEGRCTHAQYPSTPLYFLLARMLSGYYFGVMA